MTRFAFLATLFAPLLARFVPKAKPSGIAAGGYKFSGQSASGVWEHLATPEELEAVIQQRVALYHDGILAGYYQKPFNRSASHNSSAPPSALARLRF